MNNEDVLVRLSSMASRALELLVGLVAAWCVTVWSKPMRRVTKAQPQPTKSKNKRDKNNSHPEAETKTAEEHRVHENATAACLFAGIVFGEAFCVLLKRMVRQSRPSPDLCGKNGDAANFGMPSSHSEVAFFLLTYLACKFCAHNIHHHHHHTGSVWHVLHWVVRVLAIAGSAMVAALAIAASRVPLGCHTTAQVAAGALLGFALGLLWWFAAQPWLLAMKRTTRALGRLLHWAVPQHGSTYLVVAQFAVALVVTLFSGEPSRFLRFLFLHGRYVFLSDVVFVLFVLLFSMLVLRARFQVLWPLLLSCLAVCYVLYRHFGVHCDLSTVGVCFAAVSLVVGCSRFVAAAFARPTPR